MDELENPYRPGAGNQPPALTGRDELIHHFGVVVRRSLLGRPDKSLMPIGLRGVGKTVLLNRFTEIATHEGLRVIQLEAREHDDFRAVLGSRLRKVALELQRTGPTDAIRKLLGMLKAFSVQTPDGTSWTLDVEPLLGHADSGNLADDITDLMVGIGEATRSRQSGFLLTIDEVQYLGEVELAALIAAIHRTVQLNLPVLLTGAGLPQLPGLAGEARSYAERLFEFPEIGKLDPEDAAAALQIPAQAANAEFSEEALAVVLEEAHGYPYFLQEWGFNVWNAAEHHTFSAHDVERARSKVTARLDRDFFLVRYDRLTPMERGYLRAMAELGPGPHRSGDIAACLGSKVESVAPRRSALIKKGMIYSPAHGDTAFTVPLFDRYLKRVMPNTKPAARGL